MLNITSNSINDKVNRLEYEALKKVESRQPTQVLIRLIGAIGIFILLFVFIPWTQNIRAKGTVTTLKPDQRPQTIHSIIAGRIEEWYVKEGDYVKKGDTILFISEIKDEYFDPNLLGRTEKQLKAKEQSVNSYASKVNALDRQIAALKTSNRLKLQQAENKLMQAGLKVTSDSIDYEAEKINNNIALEQFKRMESLYNDGLKSLTDLENRKMTMQKAQAKMISQQNKLLTSENELINAKVELNAIQAKFQDEISKAESDKFTAMSNMYDAEATVTKMQNTYSNYEVRTSNHHITAPQNGYVTKALQSGVGETVKEGEAMVSIMPAEYDLAIEMYVRPIDLPLLEKGQHVRVQFDGWPAIVFSGWPNTSYGTYGGEVFAIDNFISDNGLYRVLVAHDPDDHEWPDALRVGAGTNNMLLLKNVPIWYEIWRNINGFPPVYYKDQDQKIEEPKKAKIKIK